MAKTLRLNNLCDKCNEAINEKKIELLKKGLTYTKEAIVIEILKEWVEGKNKQK